VGVAGSELVDPADPDVAHPAGDTVIIVTARRRAMEDYTAMGAAMAVENFVEKYQVPVAGIHFTEGQLKGKTLRRMGVDLHYDDDEEEIEEAEVWGVDTVWVKHPADE